MKNTKTTHFA